MRCPSSLPSACCEPKPWVGHAARHFLCQAHPKHRSWYLPCTRAAHQLLCLASGEQDEMFAGLSARSFVGVISKHCGPGEGLAAAHTHTLWPLQQSSAHTLFS